MYFKDTFFCVVIFPAVAFLMSSQVAEYELIFCGTNIFNYVLKVLFRLCFNGDVCMSKENVCCSQKYG